MPDDSRQTFNQARYDAIYIDTDDSGTPIVTEPTSCRFSPRSSQSSDPTSVRPRHSRRRDRDQARRASYHHATTSGRRDGTRHSAAAENRRRSEQNWQPQRRPGFNLTNLAEGRIRTAGPCGPLVLRPAHSSALPSLQAAGYPSTGRHRSGMIGAQHDVGATTREGRAMVSADEIRDGQRAAWDGLSAAGRSGTASSPPSWRR